MTARYFFFFFFVGVLCKNNGDRKKKLNSLITKNNGKLSSLLSSIPKTKLINDGFFRFLLSRFIIRTRAHCFSFYSGLALVHLYPSPTMISQIFQIKNCNYYCFPLFVFFILSFFSQVSRRTMRLRRLVCTKPNLRETTVEN